MPDEEKNQPNQKSGEQPNGQTEGQPEGQPKKPEPTADEIVVKFKDDAARQEWLDNQFSERYKRKQAEIREEQRAEVEKEYARKQAKEKGEYKELYESAETKIGEQAQKIQELETKATDVEAKDERIKALEEQVEAFIKPDLERVPEHYRELVGAMSLDQQASWLTRNREQLAGPGAPIGSLPSPSAPPRDNTRDRRESDKEAAEAQSARVVARL